MTWTCPRCERSFGVKRAHVCEPGMPVEVRLDAFDEPQRAAAEAVLAIVRTHRELIVEAVGVGIFVKRERNVLELRPKQRWLDLLFVSTQTITGRRIVRTYALASATCYVVRLRDAKDVDAELRRWLARALKA